MDLKSPQTEKNRNWKFFEKNGCGGGGSDLEGGKLG